MLKKISCLVMTALVVSSALCGCGKNTGDNGGIVAEVTTTSDSYPIDTDQEITYYCGFGNLAGVVTSMGETEFVKNLTKSTGIKIKFEHPTVGQAQESYNLMFASGDYPDIIEYGWSAYPGGVKKAIDDKVIYPLNDIIDKAAPNFKAFLNEHPEVKKDISVDGQIYIFPFYRGDDLLCTSYGPMLRGDLLERLGLEAPETIDEWEEVLKGFKGLVETPFFIDLTPSILNATGDNMFVGAYNVGSDLYLDGKSVKYGPYEPGFREMVTRMASWYQEGLIAQDFNAIDSKMINAKFINNQVGGLCGWNGSTFGTIIPSFREKNADGYLIPTKYPVLNKGDNPEFGHKDRRILGIGAAISTDCKNVEIAARLLDYGYSDAGYMLYNFGEEGVSYEIKDGSPVYTDVITNAEEISSMSMSQALNYYSRVSASGPFVQSKDYILQFYREDVQKQALETWSQNNGDKHSVPMLSYSDVDSTRLSAIMSDIRTYVDETVVKMIMGKIPLSEYDNFLKTINSMGISDAIDIVQRAYDEYEK